MFTCFLGSGNNYRNQKMKPPCSCFEFFPLRWNKVSQTFDSKGLYIESGIIWLDLFPLCNRPCIAWTVKQCSISLQADAKSHLACSPCPAFVACFILFLKPSFCSKELFIHLTFLISPFLCVKGCFPSITVNEHKRLITKGISEQEQTKAKACSAFSITQIMIQVTQ